MLNNPWPLDLIARERAAGLRREAADQRIAREASAEPEVVWHSLFPGADFRLLASGPEMLIAQMRFRRGAVARLHHHGSAQAGYVLTGRLRVTLPDQQITVAAGQCYLLPAGVPHQIRALDDSFVLDFFAPGEITEGHEAEILAGNERPVVEPTVVSASSTTDAGRRTTDVPRVRTTRRARRPRAAATRTGEEPRDAA